MKNMKHTLPIYIFLMFAAVMFSTDSHATCVKSSGDIIEYTPGQDPVRDTRGSGQRDSCGDIPTAYRLSFYKIAICKSDPQAGAVIGGSPDFSSCGYIYNGPALDHDIKYPSKSSLETGEFSIPPGSYNYLVAVFSNKLGMKNTVNFSSAVDGRGGSRGTTCWTVGGNDGVTSFANEGVSTVHGTTVADGVSTISCGTAAEAAPGWNYEIFTHFGGDDGCVDDFSTDADFSNGAEPGTDFSAILLQANGKYADRCANSAKMLFVVNHSTPFIITTTSTYALDFLLTDAVSIDFGNPNGEIVKMGNDPVQAVFTVTN